VARREQVVSELMSAVAGDATTSGLLQSGLRSGTVFYQARERGKDAAVRVMFEGKLPFVELGRRLADRGVIDDPKHVFLLLDSELDEIISAPQAWRERLARRAADFAELSLRRAPYIVVHGEPIAPISDWPLHGEASTAAQASAGDQLTGIGVSPGMARGRARVASNLSELSDLEPGDIIVCSTTDPSWVPLFLMAGGVVCDIGAPSSHAAIVSREIGVPCIVSVPAVLAVPRWPARRSDAGGLDRLGCVGYRSDLVRGHHQVVHIASCVVVEVAGAGHQPQLGRRRGAVDGVRRQVCLGVRGGGVDDERHRPPVAALSDDDVASAKLPQPEEDGWSVHRVDVADDDRRTDVARPDAAGVPAGDVPAGRLSQRPVSAQSHPFHRGIDAYRRDDQSNRRGMQALRRGRDQTLVGHRRRSRWANRRRLLGVRRAGRPGQAGGQDATDQQGHECTCRRTPTHAHG
jgi:phosphohistidine swiveling domain-containing protein